MSEIEDKYISLFTQAEIATFTPRELREYEDSRKAYRDLKNSLDTAKRDGIKEGLEKGRAEGLEEGMEKGLKKGLEKGRAEGRAEGERLNSIAVAKELKAMGLDDDAIMRATKLSASDLAELCND